jgi:hypothetical protein
VNAFLAANSPLTSVGEAALAGVVSEVSWPLDRGAVVVVNNSLFPDGVPNRPLGLLHMGRIEHPDPTARRVINSLGAMPAGDPFRQPLPPDRVTHFLSRTDLD